MSLSLAEIVTLETLDKNLFRSRFHCENYQNSVFGGQVLSQALMACHQTVEDKRLPHSLHAYFLRAGSSNSPIIYDVESVRDGRSIVNRRAVARQNGRPIFHLSASFHEQEQGFHHLTPYPEGLPEPEELIASGKSKIINATELAANVKIPFEILPISTDLFTNNTPSMAEGFFWLRSSEECKSEIFKFCALAFASDIGLLSTVLLPHKTSMFDENIFAASIDHAIWFHEREFSINSWMLCHTTSPWANNGRGFTRAHIYNHTKQLVVSTAQEGLIRRKRL